MWMVWILDINKDENAHRFELSKALLEKERESEKEREKMRKRER